jgi:hypothetical protein
MGVWIVKKYSDLAISTNKTTKPGHKSSHSFFELIIHWLTETFGQDGGREQTQTPIKAHSLRPRNFFPPMLHFIAQKRSGARALTHTSKSSSLYYMAMPRTQME